MGLSKVSPGLHLPWDVNVVVEIPERDKTLRALFVDRFLHTAMYSPATYGFILQTFTGDDSPISTLLLSVMGTVAEFERAHIRERQQESKPIKEEHLSCVRIRFKSCMNGSVNLT